ncbi:MAG: TonB-dependent receptor [Flavobacterium sp. BFFFF2]|nr:MAG: TonB-dependent receptor [Flavobacterium sp. BFFFF2]
MFILRYSFLLLLVVQVQAQTSTDSMRVNTLDTVHIKAKSQTMYVLPEQAQGILFAGKKTQQVNLHDKPFVSATNQMRQALAAVPGVSIWESDGSGVQINIGFRGLSPNRSWELNTRQNGYDIAADVFGYPEAYYNPPLDAVESIQLVRGGSALAFGPQIGGSLNYVLKRETEKPFAIEANTSIGSFNMLSHFMAVGGKKSKWTYYGYHHLRKGDGWRSNNGYQVRHLHGYLAYQINPAHQLSAEITRMDYQVQQPGGLTDLQFAQNPRQSNRARNWFGVQWHIAQLKYTAQWNQAFSSHFQLTGLLADRNSVGFTDAITKPDVIDPATNNYAPRRVDIDEYENLTFENRQLWQFKLGQQKQQWAFGFRLYQAHTFRRQKGVGSSNWDMDFAATNDFFKTAMDYRTRNMAYFTEWIFKPSANWRIVPGIRHETVQSLAEGNIDTNTPINQLKQTRQKTLVGLGIQWQHKQWNYMANVSQSFRPVLFSDLTPAAPTDVVDPQLKDATAVSAELGARGNLTKWFQLDITLFYMQYNNRIGTLTQWTNPNQPSLGTYLYRTNVGTSIHQGIELGTELQLHKLFKWPAKTGNYTMFANLSFTDARYQQLNTQTAAQGNLNAQDLTGNFVEYAPQYIHTVGLTAQWNQLTIAAQCRMNGRVFTDAQNTIAPSANGQSGALAAYEVADLNLEWKSTQQWQIKAGISNLFDKWYATRRASGYPGPGLLPAEGRSFVVTVTFKS